MGQPTASSLPLTALVRWHRFLQLPRQAQPWYRRRLKEELCDRRVARSVLQRLSETADVFYIISRSHHDGHPLASLPPFAAPHILVFAYLVPKFTLRWAFYRIAARLSSCPKPASVREVINPAKYYKLYEVAGRHGIDPSTFMRVCHRLRLVWPLLP